MLSGTRHTLTAEWHRIVAFAVAGLLALVLAACSSGKDPFEKEGPTAMSPKGKTPPAVALHSVQGMPPGLVADFKTVLAVSAGQRDIGIIEGDILQGNFSLDGVFQATAESGGTRIAFQWTLRDEKKMVVDQASGEETGSAPKGDDPWSGVGPDALQRIADKTAAHLATKLASMGYATRVVSLVTPPTETFASAGWGAKNEIDYETLNGPGAIDPSTALAEPPPQPLVEVPPEEVAAAEPEPAPETTAAKENATVIRAVAVVPVKGAPGGGNAELTQAMRETLAKAGWPVLKAPRKDAITIAGRVQVAAATGERQQVKVDWVVSHPQGATLGDIKQSNAVPAGSLDQGFGSAATMVAEAAATGIFDLIRKYR